MGLTEEPSKLSSRGDDNLSKSVKGGKRADSPKSNKLPFKKIPTQKVHVGVGTIKGYIPQVTISNDSTWESKGKDNPSPTLGHPWTRDSMSLGLEEAHEVDEAMKWVLEQGGVRRVLAKRDAFHPKVGSSSAIGFKEGGGQVGRDTNASFCQLH